MNEPTRSLARITECDFMIDDHGLPMLHCMFDYEDGGCQGLGQIVDIAFLMRFMAVFGLEYLRQAKGLSCWVTHVHERIMKIEPLHKRDGRPFDIDEWAQWFHKKQYLKGISYREMRGEEPLALPSKEETIS